MNKLWIVLNNKFLKTKAFILSVLMLMFCVECYYYCLNVLRWHWGWSLLVVYLLSSYLSNAWEKIRLNDIKRVESYNKLHELTK